jgi:hypothetical protein
MKSSAYRRLRRRPAGSETAAFKKDNQPEQQFFGETMHEPFFKPTTSMQANTAVHRKCADCEKEEKLQRSADKKEEEKVMKKEDKREEEKVMKKEEKKEEKINKKEAVASTDTTASNYIGSINGKGQSMDAGVQSYYENRIGTDFSDVKIHTAKDAADSAKDINAQAYAYGNHIVFGEGKYQPETNEGKHLLAHELAHVVQQSNVIQKQPAEVVPTPSQVPIIEYNPGKGIAKEYTIPAEDPTGPDINTIQISTGEQILFNVSATDKDKKRTTPSEPWVESEGTGPYEIDFKVSGNGEFDSAGSGLNSKQIASLNSGNVSLFIKSTWDGKTTITVTATVKDNAQPLSATDKGSVKDPDKVYTWNLVARKKNCPASLKKVYGPAATAWTKTEAIYGYMAMPDSGTTGRPDYQGQTVLEKFGSVSSLGFTMRDIEDSWKTANASLTTPDMVAAHIWGSGLNGTFVFDSQDIITDKHSGFGIVPPYPFKTTAYEDGDGVGWRLMQQYVCGGVVISTHTIDRRFTKANGKEVRKSDP